MFSARNTISEPRSLMIAALGAPWDLLLRALSDDSHRGHSLSLFWLTGRTILVM
jgi:hypothetical protein